MKSIELTEEHKAKLLEMCKALFPEYKHFGFGHDTLEHGIMEYHKGDWDNCNFTHWFEFCMTHLLDKIFSIHDECMYKEAKEGNLDSLDITVATYLQMDVIEGKNPIDTLHTYFKQIKTVKQKWQEKF